MNLPARAAVLGSPVGHSKSPALHAAAYEHLGIGMDYSAIDLTEAQLPEFMGRTRSESGWAGLSVTMPLKGAMVREVDVLSGPAADLAVVNTVTFDGGRSGRGSRLTGHNTDVAGITGAVEYAGGSAAQSAVILGAGGTSLAAVAALALLGVTGVSVCVRTPARTAATVALAERYGLAVAVVPLQESATIVRRSGLVISTLPPHAADGIAADPLLRGHQDPGQDANGPGGAPILLDAAYEPWPSALATTWAARGGRTVNGLEMLLYQGLEQVRLFTGGCFGDPDGVINAMCDAVGLPRRGRAWPDMAG